MLHHNSRDAQPARAATAVEQLEDRLLFSTYIVTGSGDGAGVVKQLLPGIYSATTLRSAVAAANATTAADNVLINPFFAGTIKLDATKGEIPITSPLTLQGFGANRQTIDGNGAGRVFNVALGVTATISDLTVANGLVSGQGGGGIRNEGNLTLQGLTISNNETDIDGAGVFNKGTLTVTSSTFVNNRAGGSGGALFNALGATATVTNSTFFGNVADFGGAISNTQGATLLVNNSTISGNTARDSGGGISATLADQNDTPGTRLNNTIVAGNKYELPEKRPGISQGNDLYGFFDNASAGNLIGALGDAKGLNAATNLMGYIAKVGAPIDARLAPLGYYGGTTQTMPPMPNSPAINAGNNAVILAGLKTDQRGLARLLGTKVDIGAVETAAKWTTANIVTVKPPTTPLASPFATATVLAIAKSLFA